MNHVDTVTVTIVTYVDDQVCTGHSDRECENFAQDVSVRLSKVERYCKALTNGHHKGVPV